ncbi:cytochrome P450 71D10-like [Salvia hispanica]|uniref:cytochrome P450 71D10-like n=1 Tax=Salvia hispanica TaxID=49212 RepID=UPI002008FCF3|nr:cytochrome P450 71D10-like [Salvia hispanica]
MELNIQSILIILLPFLLFLYMFLKSQTISKSAKIYSHFPGPKPLPLIGNLHLMLRASSGPHRLFRSLAAKHGPLMHLQLGELHFLIVSSIEFAKEVMKTHDANFSNRPPMLATEELAYNSTDLIFSPYGDHWRHLRKICTVELLTARRVRSFRSIREEEVTNMCNWIASREGSSIDLSERLYLSAYDVIVRVAAAKADAEDRETMISLSMETTKLASGFMLADLYPSIKLLPLVTGARFKIRRIHRKLDEMLDGMIQQQRAAAHRGNEAKVEGFLDILLRFERDGTLTTDHVKAVLQDILLGGTDTSASTIEWAMSELMRNPSKLNKAQQEIRNVFHKVGSYVDEDKFDELKYLRLIIKETLRLHPPVPLVAKLNSERCEINGYEIPAKTRVLVNAWALGRDPEHWNDPEKFIPERFEESSVGYNGSNLEYIPFGAGRRICAGILLAQADIELPLAMLLYHFDWKMPNGKKAEELAMTESFGATLHKKHPLRLIPIVKRPLRGGA